MRTLGRPAFIVGRHLARQDWHVSQWAERERPAFDVSGHHPISWDGGTDKLRKWKSLFPFSLSLCDDGLPASLGHVVT